MKLEKLKVNVKDIATTNPITNKSINRGYRCEIAYKASVTGEFDYKLDNKSYLVGGDQNNGNYRYQVKANRCEIKLVKDIKETAETAEELLDIYTKYNKANRYVYVIEVNDETYAITMNMQEFKEFVTKFFKYSQSAKTLRININDKTIYQWARLKA